MDATLADVLDDRVARDRLSELPEQEKPAAPVE
jgi:hypothetical protein